MSKLASGSEYTKEEQVIYGMFAEDIERFAWELYYYKNSDFPSLQRVREVLGRLVWKVHQKLERE